MTRHVTTTLAAAGVLAAFALGVPALAAVHGNTSQHDMSMPAINYDKATETTITGTVESTMEVPGQHSMSGVHLVLATNEGTVHVHVGPASYLASQHASFKKGDKVTVIGSKVKGEGFEAVLARQIKKGNETVTVRSEAGKPLW